MERDLELELAVARARFMETVAMARQKARQTFDTGDRAQSGICIQEHLDDEEKFELVDADHYHCPHCDHCLKNRSGTPQGVPDTPES